MISHLYIIEEAIVALGAVSPSVSISFVEYSVAEALMLHARMFCRSSLLYRYIFISCTVSFHRLLCV